MKSEAEIREKIIDLEKFLKMLEKDSQKNLGKLIETLGQLVVLKWVLEEEK